MADIGIGTWVARNEQPRHLADNFRSKKGAFGKIASESEQRVRVNMYCKCMITPLLSSFTDAVYSEPWYKAGPNFANVEEPAEFTVLTEAEAMALIQAHSKLCTLCPRCHVANQVTISD